MNFKNAEKIRKKFNLKKDLFTILSFLILLIGLVFFIFNIYLSEYNPCENFFLFLGIAVIILSIIIFVLGIEVGGDKYIRLLIYIEKRAIKEIYPRYSKFNNKYFNIELFDNNLILDKPSFYSFEKSFEGKIDSILFYYSAFHFQYSQVVINKESSNISSSSIDGNIIIFDLDNSDFFKNCTVNKPILYIRLAKKIDEKDIKLGNELLQKVEYESSEFNEIFDCFCNDKLFAFKVISPKVIIELLKLNKFFKDKKIPANSYNSFSIIFNENKVFIFLKIHPSIFQLSIEKEFDEVQYARAKKEFELPLDFYNALDLNKYIL